MDAFSDRVHDPLLFLSCDKSDMDNFLMNPSPDIAHLTSDDLHIADVKMENSLDLDTLEGNGHLGDMNWLHNSSLSTLAHLDGDDTNDGTNLISVNPQSVLPMQIIDQCKPDDLLSSENANSAAMRLHANCSNLLGTVDPEEHIQTPNSSDHNVISQDHQTIRILSVASTGSGVSSPVKTQNYLITSTRDSPLKTHTYVLNTGNGTLTQGLTVTTPSSPHQKASVIPTSYVLASPQKLHAIAGDKSGRVLFKAGSNLLSPSQASPVLLGRLQTGVHAQAYQSGQVVSSAMSSPINNPPQQSSDTSTVSSTTSYGEERSFPKPVFSYSCLIALALKNSENGSLPVSEIYNFMCENFPYFKTAPDGWKNSVRHNLSLNKCFAKVDNPKLSQGAKKGCLWALNPAKIAKMEDEISKWGKKDPAGLLCSMAFPENLEAIEKGEAGLHYAKKLASEKVASTPHKAEATPAKIAYSPVVKQEYASMELDNFHARLQQTESTHSVQSDGSERMEYPAEMCQTYSPAMRHVFTDSPTLKRETLTPDKNINPLNPEDMYNVNQRIINSNETHPTTINAEALADIVLQNGMWDSDDLEKEIDIDLICESPSSSNQHLPHLTVHSPMPANSSPNLARFSQSTGQCSPSVQAMYTNFSNSHASSPTPSSVRNNLFGVSTTPCRTLYA